MDGALLMWTELLQRLSLESSTFLSILVQKLFATLAIQLDRNVEQDADKEAYVWWLLELLREDNAFILRPEEQTRLRDHTLKLCCLHPGYWSLKLGRTLADSDEELADEWRDFLEASSLRDPAAEDSEAMQEADVIEAHAASVLDDEEAAQCKGGWSRAAIALGWPIGVI